MDEIVKDFYKTVYRLDTLQCFEVTESLKSLEFKGRLPSQSLEDFVFSNALPVCMEHYSSEHLLKDHHPSMKSKYVERSRFYGVIMHTFMDNPEMGKRAIGFVDTIQVYNGFPGVVDSGTLAENPKKAFDEAKVKLEMNPLIKFFMIPLYFGKTPEKTETTRVFLLKEFYDEYIRKDGKIR